MADGSVGDATTAHRSPFHRDTSGLTRAVSYPTAQHCDRAGQAMPRKAALASAVKSASVMRQRPALRAPAIGWMTWSASSDAPTAEHMSAGAQLTAWRFVPAETLGSAGGDGRQELPSHRSMRLW